MKRICLITLVASLFSLSHSCVRDGIEPTSDEYGSSGYDTAEEAMAAVDSLYRTGASAFYGGCTAEGIPAAMTGGWISGHFDSEAETCKGLWESCRNLAFNDESMASYTADVWEQAYGAIKNCNVLISAVPNTQWFTDEQKKTLIAEARFFRAFNYFYLARTFGGVPVVTRSDGVAVGSGFLKDVYKLIVSDLESTIATLCDTTFPRNGFRVSRSSAQTLLADVYLTMSGMPLRQKSYAEAAEAAKSVIKGGEHALASNGSTPEESAWNRLRTQSDNIEHIFSYTAGEANRSLAAFCLPREATDWGVVKTNTSDAYSPSQAMMNVYDTYVDTRSKERQLFHSFVKYEKGNRTVIRTFSPKSHWWFDETVLFEGGTVAGDVTIYRYAEVLLIAAEAIAMSEGVTYEAAGYLADVRSRAYPSVDRETILGELTAMSAEKFVEEVWIERLREFPFEMKIWPDIQRTRKYPVAENDGKGSVTFRDVIGASKPSGATFEERHLLLPCPR